MRRALATALALLAALVAAGCGAAGTGGVGIDETVEGRKLRVVATTNFITDLARELGGDDVEVEGLMGPGVDPHLYKASAGDVQTLRDGDVILYGGLELEGKMSDLLEELGEERRTVAVTADMPDDRLRREPQAPDKTDPHVWFDVELWTFAARTAAAALKDADPANGAAYDRRLAAYLEELEALDAEVERTLRPVPRRSRVLVTSHDAFNYFGAAYDFDVVAIQGVSTQTEATTADIKRVADLLAERDVRSVFVESSVPRQTIEAVLEAAAQRGHRAQVGGELFSDAAGETGTPEGTYVGMVRHNARLIARGLS